MWAKSLGRNKAYLSLFFAISNVLNNISPWQKNTCVEGKLCRARNQGHENWPCLLIVWILLHRSSLWQVRYIPETFLVSYQQKILNQIKLAFTYQGLKHTGGSIRWMQLTSERTLCRCTWLRSRFAENDVTDFGMWDEKWCNGLFSVLAAIAFCWHIIEVRIEWESELASQPVNKMGETRYFCS